MLLSYGLSFVAAWTSFAQASVTTEYRSKANFLGSFASFVDWPAQSFTSSSAPIDVCVFGDFQFGTALAESLRGQISSHKVEIRWIRKDQDTHNCHVLFVSRSEEKRYSRVLQSVHNAAVLTVGETPEFLAAGGMITLWFDRDVLRFDVNLPVVNESHLKINSRLLLLAHHVIEKPGSGAS